MITTDSTRDAVRAFAQAVRAALADLPADEIDELTDGLEADLSDRAADAGGTDAFGDPSEYADELRAAAGLPPRSAPPRRSMFHELRSATAAMGAAAMRRLRANPLAAWLLELAVSLRPVWWIARGWTVWQVLTLAVRHESFGLIPVYGSALADARQWLILLAIVVVSVQWGRGRWLPGRWVRRLKVLVSVGALVALLPAAGFAVSGSHAAYAYASAAETGSAPDGLFSSGQEIYNIFAYDADGKPLQNVRLYDQDGHPVFTNPYPDAPAPFSVVDGTSGDSYTVAPNQRADGPLGWAVYPLTGTDGAPTAPFAEVQPLSAETPTPTPGASAPASPTPTPTSQASVPASPTPAPAQ